MNVAAPNIVFRVDSSGIMGLGHQMRCLTLADSLREVGATVSFLCRDLPGNSNAMIEERGYAAIRLPGTQCPEPAIDIEQTRIALRQLEPIHWLVVDHYDLDHSWEKALRPQVRAIVVIDDKADRKHECELLVDQNYFEGFERRYDGLVPSTCRTLLGPEFALLRPEFHKAKADRKPVSSAPLRILAFFGGADPANETGKFLTAVAELERNDIVLDVLIGPMNRHREQIERAAILLPNTRCIPGTRDMSGLMASADISVGAGGTTTWERFYLGIPSIVVAIADNQEIVARDLAALGAQIYLGAHHEVRPQDYKLALNELLDRPELRNSLAQASLRFVDGRGTERVRDALMGDQK